MGSDRPEHKRDTLPVPPDVTKMLPMEALQLLVNWRFEDHELLRRVDERLRRVETLAELCSAQLVTNDLDPRTIAQRLQTAEAAVAYLHDEKLRIEQASHELRQSVTDLEERHATGGQ